MTIARRRSNRRVAVSVPPYRNSNVVPQPIKPQKVCFWEYGNEYDETNGNWTPFVDIISGNSDLVDFVGFKFQTNGEFETYNVYSRSPTILSDGTVARRFSIKRTSFPSPTRMSIVVIGRGNSSHLRRFNAKKMNSRSNPLLFYEPRSLRSHYLTIPNVDFGVEFELSCSEGTDYEEIARYISENANVLVKSYMSDYQGAKEEFGEWKLVYDGSLVCQLSSPNCSKFELVSRILNGEDGLGQCNRVLQSVRECISVSLNTSMAIHVHVNVGGLNLERLKNVCLNFIKYEEEIDTFMPPSRRANRNEYCMSNRDAIKKQGNGEKHKAIVDCTSLYDLCVLVSPDKYYKLNLNNLKEQRITTMEFRQHSCSCNFNKVQAWVHFCTRLVHNSIHRPRSLKYDDNPFELLFDTVIQDIRLKDYYRQRKHEVYEEENNYDERIGLRKLVGGNNHEQCCDGCADGHVCEASQG